MKCRRHARVGLVHFLNRARQGWRPLGVREDDPGAFQFFLRDIQTVGIALFPTRHARFQIGKV
jgi:hypothetical protein